MSFGSGGGSGGGQPPPNAVLRSFDLAGYVPRAVNRRPRWCHRVRNLDNGGWVAVPEAAVFVGPDGTGAIGSLSSRGWVLRQAVGRDVAAARLEFDDRWRVAIPLGVRHRFGLCDSVVVSASMDGTCTVIWPVASPDELLEVGS